MASQNKNKMQESVEIGLRLKNLRKEKGLSIKRLSDKFSDMGYTFGFSEDNIKKDEAGRNNLAKDTPNTETKLQTYADFYDVSYDYLRGNGDIRIDVDTKNAIGENEQFANLINIIDSFFEKKLIFFYELYFPTEKEKEAYIEENRAERERIKKYMKSDRFLSDENVNDFYSNYDLNKPKIYSTAFDKIVRWGGKSICMLEHNHSKRYARLIGVSINDGGVTFPAFVNILENLLSITKSYFDNFVWNSEIYNDMLTAEHILTNKTSVDMQSDMERIKEFLNTDV